MHQGMSRKCVACVKGFGSVTYCTAHEVLLRHLKSCGSKLVCGRLCCDEAGFVLQLFAVVCAGKVLDKEGFVCCANPV
jgi:hypothetical protein